MGISECMESQKTLPGMEGFFFMPFYRMDLKPNEIEIKVLSKN